MILNRTPLPLAFLPSYIKELDSNQVMSDYLKKFSKLSKEDAEKMAAEIRSLNNPKVKEEYLIKILDLYPQDAEDLNKIFVDASLTEEESSAILAIVKKY